MNKYMHLDFPVAQTVKILPAMQAGDPGLIPGLGRSPGEGNGNPLQYSCLENPMARGAWQATVHGVAKSPTQLKRLSKHEHSLCVEVNYFKNISNRSRTK